MPKQIRMPKLSDTMEEGRLIAWRKSVGDPVKRGEILAEIETDKADMEFESFAEGTIASLAIEPGATVSVGTLIAVIALPGEEVADALAAVQAAPAAAPATPAAPAAAAPAAAAAPVAAAAPAPAPSLAPPSPVIVRSAPSQAPIVVSHVDDGRIRATPAARRLAEERSVDLTELDGTGPAGAIVNGDVEAYLAELDRTEPPKEGPRATPVALRMAEELGVDLDTVKGSGPAGRITKSDLLDHSKNEALRLKDREAELFAGAVELSQKRKALIRNMVQSKAEAPHFYLQMDAQTDSLRELRDRVNGEGVEGRPRVTYTHLMIKASALALERFPEANATYRSDEHNIALFDAINIGLAVDVNDELVAPTIKDCQGKGIFQLVGEANELIQRARMRKLQPQDYADGTFTISNLGMFGVSRFYAIITPPQSSILSVSAIEPRPVVRDGEVAISTMTTLGLSVDHRVLDGVKAAQFLAELKRLLEEPEELLRDEAGFGD
jgi:pyruvate dehydrogenase E2 component (dihydrolipoamide acetyltransferase)